MRSKGFCQVFEENQQQTLGSNQVHNPSLSGSPNENEKSKCVKPWSASVLSRYQEC